MRLINLIVCFQLSTKINFFPNDGMSGKDGPKAESAMADRFLGLVLYFGVGYDGSSEIIPKGVLLVFSAIFLCHKAQISYCNNDEF
jgi:hypothetical protein